MHVRLCNFATEKIVLFVNECVIKVQTEIPDTIVRSYRKIAKKKKERKEREKKKEREKGM